MVDLLLDVPYFLMELLLDVPYFHSGKETCSLVGLDHGVGHSIAF